MAGNLAQLLKSWHFDKRMLTSPPIKSRTLFLRYKQLLIRSWIHADCDESRGVIRISLNPDENFGKSNIEKLEKFNIIVG